jgi:hypothetical protein
LGGVGGLMASFTTKSPYGLLWSSAIDKIAADLAEVELRLKFGGTPAERDRLAVRRRQLTVQLERLKSGVLARELAPGD